MNKAKKSISIIILIIVLGTILALPANAATKKQKAFKAYAKWIKSDPDYGADYIKNTRYAFAYIDGDKIPELIVKHQLPIISGDRRAYSVLAYKKGKVNVLNLHDGVASAGGFRGEIYYIPKMSMLLARSWASGTGYYSEDIYQLKKSEWNKAYYGTYIRNYSSSTYGQYEIKDCNWQGKSVSPKKYARKLKKVFDEQEGILFTDIKYMTKSKILKKLKK